MTMFGVAKLIALPGKISFEQEVRGVGGGKGSGSTNEP